MSTIRLAYAADVQTVQKTFGAAQFANDPLPLLVSYVYWNDFAQVRRHLHIKDIALDSGAFSAHQTGREVNLDAYIKFCKDFLEHDVQATEVFALDVIGDWQQSLTNCERMWNAGIPAIPSYHVGEPLHVLKTLAATYPKIALGGAVGLHGTKKREWASACFGHVWPKKIHGLGFGSEGVALALPFHSVDSTNWLMHSRFGRYHFANGKVPLKGCAAQNLAIEVEHYRRLERKAKQKWQQEMAILDIL